MKQLRRLAAACCLCTLVVSVNGEELKLRSSTPLLVEESSRAAALEENIGRRLDDVLPQKSFRESISVRGVNASTAYQMPAIGLGTSSKKMRLSASTFLEYPTPQQSWTRHECI